MIRRIQVKNYKSLKDIEVNLKQLAVIFGPNAAGKSNLFDALNLLARMVTKKNLKEAFDGHRGLPLEAVHYDKGSVTDLSDVKMHVISFSVDVELSDSVVRDVENRIREMRRKSDDDEKMAMRESAPSDATSKAPAKIVHRLLRYDLELEILSSSGQMRVRNESLDVLPGKGGRGRPRKPFLEKKGSELRLRMERQAHPTSHEVGLDYTIASMSLYAPHYPHLTAFREEMSRCHFYYFEPRVLMREANAIAEVNSLGPRGEDLAAFYHSLAINNADQFKALKLAAKQILPRLQDLDVERTLKGELYLRICENKASYSNRLISEGTLRVLGLLAVLSPTSGSTTIGYEEPENGVHPRRLKQIAEMLKNASHADRQIIINTHSPVMPTYFDSENLIVCRRTDTNTEFVSFDSLGPLFQSKDIEGHLEEQILRGDFGG